MYSRTRRIRRSLASAAVLLLVFAAARLPILAQPSPQPGAQGKASRWTPNFDIRTSAALRARLLEQLGRSLPETGTAKTRLANDALAALKADRPAAVASMSPFTGGAEVVRNPRGALTDPDAGRTSRAIVGEFLTAHAALYGLAPSDVATLRFSGESVSPGSGLRMLRADQAIAGIPVFQSDARFIVDRDGRLIRTIGRLVPQAAAAGAGTVPALSSADALASVTRSLPAGAQITEVVPATLVFFPLAPGVLILAYQHVIYTDGPGDYLAIVDATTGTLLWRKNIRNNQSSTEQARFSVYVQPDGVTPADSPAPASPVTPTPGLGTQAPAIARTVVEMLSAQDPVASPAGWIPDGGTTTTGNNVDACVDRAPASNVCDPGTLDDNGRPVGNPDASARNRDFLGAAPRDFSYMPSPIGTDPDAGDTPSGTGAPQDAFRRGSVTQLFYVTNWYHDRVFHLGFDEAAGNFQTVNFSGQGSGNDAVRADVQDGGDVNNANFSTPPDGTPGRMQMYRFIGPAVDRDAALDTMTVIHELTHGLSNRLIGNASGLTWSVGAGMGEGWSDFYALSLLNGTQADDPDGAYTSGAYVTYRLGGSPFTDNYTYGIRRFPYSTDNTLSPLTWADVDDVTADYAGGIPINPLGFEQGGAFEVHNIGEVWALTLWEVRSRVIADPAGANGSVPAGNQTMLQLVTDALKLTPADPSFIDARDALLDADCATNACANERWIWEGFADRGLGSGAVAPLGKAGIGDFSHMSVGTSTAMPALGVAAVTIDDSLGNGNGAIDPGEPVRLTVALTNPWRGATLGVAGATATLTSTTPGLTIVDAASTYPAIPAGGTASGDTFLVRAGPGLACGQSIALTLQLTSALGTSTANFTRRVGLASGTGAPVTFTRTHAPGLPIPDEFSPGVSSALTVSDDLEIADLDFRVDSLSHTYLGDLTVLLRAPNGYGADLILAPGILADGGFGRNLVNTVIDDAATGDLFLAPQGLSPFTGTWRPANNSPALAPQGFPPDPVGQLSRLNGTSTRGEWTVRVADVELIDTGTLNSWSLIVTPTAFTCSAFTDTTPPATAVNLAPAAPNGAAGWHVSPVTAAVSAADSGGVLETRCALDPAAPPASFDDLPAGCTFNGAGTAVSAPGAHTLYAASVDGSGNAGPIVSAAFRIDTSPPVLACVLPAPRFVPNQPGAVVTATVTDATSGPVSPTVSAPADTTTPGARTVTLGGADVAGHVASIACPYTVAAVPTVTITGPTADPTLPATAFFLPLAGTASAGTAITSVTWSSDRGGSGTATGTTSWLIPDVPLQPGVNVLTVSATEADGDVGTDTLTVHFDAVAEHLAEGSSGAFFSMDLALANPNAVPVRVALSFVGRGGASVAQDLTLAPTSRTTVSLADVPGLSGPVSTSLSSPDMLPVGVERTMLWDATGYGGTGETAVAQPRLTWMFAEGSQGFFNTYFLLLNPNAEATTAAVTFLPEAEPPLTRTVDLPPMSRLIVDTSTVPELRDRTFGAVIAATHPILTERAMYFGNTPARLFAGGHASTGAPDAATRWLFAEGVTGPFFDTYILLANPGSSPAAVTLRYLLSNGAAVTLQRTVRSGARLTVDVEHADPQLANALFATEVTSDVPIVAERSVYWVGEPGPWTEAHSSVGVTAPGTRWLLSEGRMGGALGMQTFILLANPASTAANVTITFLKTDGTTVVRSAVVPAASRSSVYAGDVPELAGQAFGALVEVTNGVGIVVERSMYWSSGGTVWAGGTNVTAARIP